MRIAVEGDEVALPREQRQPVLIGCALMVLRESDLASISDHQPGMCRWPGARPDAKSVRCGEPRLILDHAGGDSLQTAKLARIDRGLYPRDDGHERGFGRATAGVRH